MTPIAQALTWIEQQESAMQQLLCQWVDINSHTYNLTGLDKMRIQLETAYLKLNGQCKTIPAEPYHYINDQGEMTKQPLGAILHLKSANTAKHNILLCGHMDTVYPDHDPFQHVQHIHGSYLHGPGVADMKSGLVIMLYSLLALQKFELNPHIAWQVLINADEEIGSPGSTSLIQQCAQESNLGLVFEPALDSSGTLVSERKGSIKYTITAHGKAAHAGRDISLGRNAIVALAQAIQQIAELNNARTGLTINIGRINGGKAVNVVPDFALCRVDVRCEDIADIGWIEQQIEGILNQVVQQTQVELHYHQDSKRYPKLMTPAAEKLFQLAAQCATELNFNLSWKKSGGCCDGNVIAMAGIPVLDTLGGCGENIHSPQEKLFVSSLVQRAKLTVLLLTKLSEI